ncbi:cytochrome P450 [Gloeopeniophorella convolvens]|nr:cytochrome P450 [Gloeopeniophorella convolvens]
MGPAYLVVDLLAFFLGLAFLRKLLGKRALPLPPGPKGWPLIGNLLEIPKTNLSRTYTEWGRLYGGMVFVEAAGQPIVVLNDINIANEMLDSKSSIYSDRPISQMAGPLAGFDDFLGIHGYDEHFKRMRKFTHQAIGTRVGLEKFTELFESHFREFLKALSQNPSNVEHAIRQSVASMIVLITYGRQVREVGSDPIIQLVDAGMKNFFKITKPGAFLVDLIPVLRYLPSWLPGAGFKKTALEMRDVNVSVAEVPFQWTTDEMAKGTALPSLVSHSINGGPLSEEDERSLKYAAGSLFAGVVALLHSFFLAMTLFPEAQCKAQEEIDRVVGDARLPTLADRDDMPYVNALQTELIRWASIAPVGLPHRTQADDVHRGYFIPRSSIVIANVWQMLHDANVYADPEKFSPERFIEEEGKPADRDPRGCAFGFGRRACPGKQLFPCPSPAMMMYLITTIGKQFVDTSMWLVIAMTLSVFRITKVVKDGVEVTPDVRYTGDIVRHPEAFECDVKPRSAQAETLIHQSS